MSEDRHVAFDTELCAKNPEAAADRIAELEQQLAQVIMALKDLVDAVGRKPSVVHEAVKRAEAVIAKAERATTAP